MKYTCPVCGYDQLIYPPKDYMICPCCLTEFGYDDFTASHAQLRAKWIAEGAVWKSKHTPAPNNRSPLRQLLDAGILLTDEQKRIIARAYPEKISMSDLIISKSPGDSESITYLTRRREVNNWHIPMRVS